MKKLFRWLIVSWFVVYSALFTPLAYAASPTGWGFSKYDIAKSLLTATKNGVTVAVSAAPSASTIGSYAIRFAGAAAIAYAVAKYGGSAIDWVLDPANNSVRSKDGAIPGLGGQQFCSNGQCFATPELAGAVACGSLGFDYVRDKPPYYPQYGVAVACKGGSLKNVAVQNTNYKTVGADEIGADLLTKAKSGDTSAASVVNDAMGEQVNKGTYDTALDTALAQQLVDNQTHNCGTGTHWSGSACVADTPATPSTPTTDTPFDPTSILDAIGRLFDAVMSLPDVINNALDSLLVDIKDFFQPVITKVTDTIDWIKSDPDPQPDSKPDIDTSPPTKSATDFDTEYLRFGGQCPATPSTSLSVGAVSVPLSIDLTPLCDFVVMVRPAILAMAYLSALFVVARAIGETQ